MIILFGVVSTVAVLILLLSLYRYANHNEENIYTSPLERKHFERHEKKRSVGAKWLEDLAAKKRPSHAYAVTEMEIDLPLKKKPKPHEAYRLILKQLDSYKMFCIRQILDRNGIDYAIFRKKENGILMIHNLDKKSLNRIVKLVKKYDITIETENYVKE
ncbi:hypothetical protein [Hydrogenimonas urashimensis]|uniref:hypothetical protein n=1 Tax=Hydrogenimonas urashimensis TaxID=2740515 RepID=UPI00191541EB|nr:hypothetical protein [Hydrogenimonas urashimensis]